MENRCPTYLSLAEFYETCLAKHGATPLGVDWPNSHDVVKRFKVMLEVINDLDNPVHVLDLGCGYGAMVDYLQKHYPHVVYTGIDISAKMIQTAQSLHPQQHFLNQDILREPLSHNSYDYVIMNGLLTEKRDLSFDTMVQFASAMIKASFKAARRGVAFNVMSNQVDWCSLDLFHWSFDALSTFLTQHCSRNFVLRNDYGLYEYTIYLYKQTNV